MDESLPTARAAGGVLADDLRSPISVYSYEYLCLFFTLVILEFCGDVIVQCCTTKSFHLATIQEIYLSSQ